MIGLGAEGRTEGVEANGRNDRSPSRGSQTNHEDPIKIHE